VGAGSGAKAQGAGGNAGTTARPAQDIARPTGRSAPHETALELLACGLSWDALWRLGFEEARCLLHCSAHRQALAALDVESARVASLAFAEPDEQRRALIALAHRADALERRFRRDYPPEHSG
jgi:hypothetical protein